MTPYDWYSDHKDNKIVRRNAANSFLSAVLDDPDGLGAGVTGLEQDKKNRARTEFDRILQTTSGGGPLPGKVEVICIEADTRKRANLVVFVLHKKNAKIEDLFEDSPINLEKLSADLNASTAGQLWIGRWIAAWAPY